MLIDCGTCVLAGVGCGDCVVTALLGPPEGGLLAPAERQALAVLADGGLVPPLRLVQADPAA